MTLDQRHGRPTCTGVRDVHRLARWATKVAMTSVRLQGDFIPFAHTGLAKVVRGICISLDVVVAIGERAPADVRQHILTATFGARFKLLILTLKSGQFLVHRAHVLRRLERFLRRHEGGLIDLSELSFEFGSPGAYFRFIAGTECVLQKFERGVCSTNSGDNGCYSEIRNGSGGRMKRLYVRLVLWLIRPALRLDWDTERGQGIIDVSLLGSSASREGKDALSR